MGLILGRKYGGKGEREKGQGGKAKMTASSHWISIQLVGGRKRGKISEGTKTVCTSWETFSHSPFSLPCLLLFYSLPRSFFLSFLSLLLDLCCAAIQLTRVHLISQAEIEILRANRTICPCANIQLSGSISRETKTPVESKNSANKDPSECRKQPLWWDGLLWELQGIHAGTGSSALKM